MNIYLPDIYQKSIYTLDYTKLLSRGIKCILFDLDNTIAPANQNTITDKTKELIISLKQKGFKVVIFSNSPKMRVQKFAEVLGIEGIHLAFKPNPRKLKKFIETSDFKISEVAIIGDQLLTDVVVGNKVGITTILISPVSSKDHIVTKINRYFENRKMKKLEAKELFSKGRYYD